MCMSVRVRVLCVCVYVCVYVCMCFMCIRTYVCMCFVCLCALGVCNNSRNYILILATKLISII